LTEALPLTPSQTVGPYLGIALLNALVPSTLVDPDDPAAVRIHGQLLDGAGDPVPDGMVEIWHADAAGRYEGSSTFGRSGTVDDGWFEFVTTKPGPVPAADGGMQAPHIVVGVFARGLLKRVVTRLYFPDEDVANAADPILSQLDTGARETLIAQADEDGLRFDIRLQGEGHSTFFAV
jgi:protocatechuate 3,4-dioxygenase alpha subunit